MSTKTDQAHERGFALLAYIFMPDHLHLLVQGQTPQAEFRSFMTLVLKRTAISFHELQGTTLWQGGYYERVLRTEEQTETVMAYIAGNPVRAGLVERVEDYPFTYLAALGPD